MKRLLTLLMALAMTASLAACGGTGSSGDTADSGNSGTTAEGGETAGSSGVEDGVLTIAMECAYAPYNWSQSDNSNGAVPISNVPGTYANGYDVMIAKQICEANGWELEVVQSDWDSLVPGVQTGTFDAVIAGQSMTAERSEQVDFAGPYYYTQQAILVLADNDDIKSVDDLADKNVAVQSGSNGPAILEEFAPKASQQEFKTDEEARQALQQGRVDAYVIDNNMQQSALVREPGKYKIAGKPFGSKEPYGIGLPLDSDGVAFVNDFLKKIEDDGTWTELWQICIGDRTGDTNVPELPEIGA